MSSAHAPAECAQRHDHPHVAADQPPLGGQPRRARRTLGRRRRVGRRRASHRGRPPGCRSASSRRRRRRLIGEFASPARCIAAYSTVAGPVAGEHPAGPVGAVGRRRQPDDRRSAGARRPSPAPAGPNTADRRTTAAWSAPTPRATPPTAGRPGTPTSRRRAAPAMWRPRPSQPPAPDPTRPPCGRSRDRRATRCRAAPGNRRARRCAGERASPLHCAERCLPKPGSGLVIDDAVVKPPPTTSTNVLEETWPATSTPPTPAGSATSRTR